MKKFDLPVAGRTHNGTLLTDMIRSECLKINYLNEMVRRHMNLQKRRQNNSS